MKTHFVVLSFLLFTHLSLPGQHSEAITLQALRANPQGMTLLEYVDILNRPQDITTEDIHRVFAASLLEKYDAHDLISFMEDVRQQQGQLAVYEVSRSSENEYRLTSKSLKHGGWFEISLHIESQAPYGINGFGFHDDASPSMAKEPLYQPSRQMAFEEKSVDYAPLQDIISNTDKLVSAYTEMGWFSGVALLAKDGKPFFEKAYGMADLENNIPNSMSTKFPIGSINKDYTAVIIMQLVQQGLLSLDDRLSRFNLGFPKSTADKITIRHLLQHRSGFGDIFIPAYLEDVRKYKTIDDMLPLLLREPLAYEPGTQQEYSNYGYIVLGAIAEKISGKAFREILDDNIHAVTGCIHTHYSTAEEITGEAKSYRYTVTGEKKDHTPMLEIPHPDGGMYATAADLLTFFQTLMYTEKLLSNPYKAIWYNDFEPTDRTWEEICHNTRGSNGYAGGGPGVSAIVGLILKDNYMVILLANTDGDVTEHIGQRMENVIRGRTYEEPALPLPNYIYGHYKKNGAGWLQENLNAILKEGRYGQVQPDMLNQLGYSLMRSGNIDEAIDVFTINVHQFPEEANPYDSLAEAWLKKGDKMKALEWYKKALEIDPDFSSAKRAVRELKNK